MKFAARDQSSQGTIEKSGLSFLPASQKHASNHEWRSSYNSRESRRGRSVSDGRDAYRSRMAQSRPAGGCSGAEGSDLVAEPFNVASKAVERSLFTEWL